MIKKFPVNSIIGFIWSGKFTAPSGEWVHMTRRLQEYEIFFVMEGTLYIADEDKKYKVEKNEYLLMPPTSKQYGYAQSECTFYWMHFNSDEELIDDLESGLQGRNKENVQGDHLNNSQAAHQEKPEMEFIPQKGNVVNMDRIIILINQLQDAARRYRHQHTLDLLASGILLEVYNQIQADMKKNNTSSKMKMYESVLNYIEWNRYQRISISEMAEYMGYHEKYLSTIFKEQAGIPLKQYLLQEVMEYAKAEMMDSKKTIAQIAYSLGYMDPHNFSHSFKKVVGISPKEYRNSCVRLAKIH